MHRPANLDIDLYQFALDAAGTFSTETIAQRLVDQGLATDPSLLNTALTLYDGNYNVVARNDDYFGTDSFIQTHLAAGTYYIGVSAKGNDVYDPTIADSGLGGTSAGDYQLRLNFLPDVETQLTDMTGQALDGDMDGVAGGAYNYWFTSQTADRTLFVDKALEVRRSTARRPIRSTTLPPPSFRPRSTTRSLRSTRPIRAISFGSWATTRPMTTAGGESKRSAPTRLPSRGMLRRTGKRLPSATASLTVTFEFDTGNGVKAGNVPILFAPVDAAATIASKIAAAINSPMGQGQAAQYSLYVQAAVAGDTTTIVLSGPTAIFSPGTSPLTKNTLTDGQTFTVSDGVLTVTFEFDNNGVTAPGDVAVPFHTGDSAVTVAAEINNAINNFVSQQKAATLRVATLDVYASVPGSQPTVVVLGGPTAIFNAGTSPLTNTLQDNVAYEIGLDASGNALADGSSLDVPKGVTVMIDAGAVIKLNGANIDVGSDAQGVDRSLGVLQVLGTPGESVYFTSYFDKSIGKGTYQGLLARGARQLGRSGLPQRPGLCPGEYSLGAGQHGIFADYVNHADIRYGGGSVTGRLGDAGLQLDLHGRGAAHDHLQYDFLRRRRRVVGRSRQLPGVAIRGELFDRSLPTLHGRLRPRRAADVGQRADEQHHQRHLRPDPRSTSRAGSQARRVGSLQRFRHRLRDLRELADQRQSRRAAR